MNRNDVSATVDPEADSSLRDYSQAVRRGWRTIVVACFVGGLVAGLPSILQSPQYAASALVEVGGDPQFASGTRRIDDLEIATQGSVLVSQEVENKAEELLGSPLPDDLARLVIVEPVENSRVLRVSVVADDAERAARLANAAAEAFVLVRQEEAGPSDIPDRVLSPARTPREPLSPNPRWDVSLGLLLGLIVGFAVVVVRQQSEDRVRSLDDLRRASGGHAVLGRISLGSRDPESNVHVASALRPRQGVDGDGLGRIVLFVGPSPAAAANVSWQVAQAAVDLGLAVGVVDAELEQRVLTRRLELEGSPGLSDLVGTGAQPSRISGMVVQQSPGLRVVPAGSPTATPAEVLSLTDVAPLFRLLAFECDLVLVVGSSTHRESLVLPLLGSVDLVGLAVPLGSLSAAEVREQAARLDRAGGASVAIVGLE